MTRLMRLLVWLYPPTLRELYADEMREVIDDRYRRALRKGRLYGLGYIVRTSAGLVGNAALAWIELALRFWRTAALDLRSIRRSLQRAPSFSLIVVLVVGISVAIATAVAGFYRGTLFAEPSFHDPDRVVLVWGSNLRSGQLRDVIAGPNFLDLRDSTETLDALAALHRTSAVILRDGRPEVLDALEVSIDFLRVLGVTPTFGRDFSEEHRRSSGPDAVIVSHGFWRDHLEASPSVVGSRLVLDGRPHAIVGVLGADFEFLAPFALLRPVQEDVLHEQDRTYHLYWMVGRLAPQATPGNATRELSSRFARIAEEDDDRLVGWSVLVEPLRRVSLEAVRPLLLAIGAAVLLVIIAASVNLATLNLARTFGRSRELFIRAMLGARGPEVLRIVLWEAGGLCAGGAVFGLFGGATLIAALRGVVPSFVPIPSSAAHVNVVHGVADTFVLVFGVAVAASMWLVLVTPALLHLRSMRSQLGLGARGAPAARPQGGTRKLVAVELALATVLLVFAGLLERTATHLLAVDPGVEPSGLLTMYVGQLQEPSEEARARYFLDVVREVERVAGVARAGASDYVPFQGEDDFMGFRLPDRPPPPPGEGFREEWRRVSDGFFEAAGLDLRHGRGFEPRDYEVSPAVTVVNASFARKYWPGLEPLGQSITIARQEYGLLEVVGVVEDVPARGPALPAPPMIFVPLHGLPRDNMGLFVRVEGDPLDYVDAVREAVWSVDSSQPIERVHTMTSLVGNAVALPRLARTLVAQFASIGLLLAVFGLFGVVSYSVRIRHAELGIRLALGATPRRLQRDLVRDTAPLAAAGLTTGLALGVGAGYLGRSLLHGTSPSDPAAFALTALIVAGAALAAVYVPARAIARVDPTLSIRDI